MSKQKPQKVTKTRRFAKVCVAVNSRLNFNGYWIIKINSKAFVCRGIKVKASKRRNNKSKVVYALDYKARVRSSTIFRTGYQTHLTSLAKFCTASGFSKALASLLPCHFFCNGKPAAG
jgi:hypothetical protein